MSIKSGRYLDILMGDTSGKLEHIGEKVMASSWWFGPSSCFHTIQISVNNFIGRIGIQGSLVLEPKEEDWFFIRLTPKNDFIIYPRNIENLALNKGETSTISFTIPGNFLWIRAIMDRKNLDYEPVSNSEISALGSVNRIILSR